MSRWRVRIGGALSPSGAGVLIDERRVLTCAHVINDVLGRPHKANDRPTEDIPLDFPSIRDSATTGRVLPGSWIPVAQDDTGDVAILTLATTVPVSAEPARLGATAYRSTEVYLFGHPLRHDLGIEAQAVLAGPSGPHAEWMQLEAARATGIRIQGGFSGAGVVAARTGLVLGLLVSEATDATVKVAWMLPVADIANRYPELSLSVVDDGRPAGSQEHLVNTLPAPIPHFVGRDGELNTMRHAVTGSGNQLPVHAITGMPGVGKSALAIHLAHELTDRFPDAQLYLDLQGHRPEDEALDSGTALSRLLRMLGVVPKPLPSTTPEWAEIWRAELCRRRAVVVLDNASSSRQVRPLIPGATKSLVLITSRHRLLDVEFLDELLLDGLSDHDAHHLVEALVGLPEAAAARELLASISDGG